MYDANTDGFKKIGKLNMTFRQVTSIHQAPKTMMGPIQIRQAFPLNGFEQLSPFILLHHFDLEIEPGINNFDVPAHPHRGFSPVTFIFDGRVKHKDSLGNEQIIGAYEVQWIDAGRGIIHSETIDPKWIEIGGRFQGIQLWINSPAKDKMNTPSYQPLTHSEIVLIQESGVNIYLVSGTLHTQKGPAKSEVLTAMFAMESDSKYSIDVSEFFNLGIYILEGQIQINEIQIANRFDLIHFIPQEGIVNIKAKEQAKLLIMGGIPLDEPLVKHGPFVMNTETEILEAMRDYQQGKMGFLY